jgi:hypothetical protein
MSKSDPKRAAELGALLARHYPAASIHCVGLAVREMQGAADSAGAGRRRPRRRFRYLLGPPCRDGAAANAEADRLEAICVAANADERRRSKDSVLSRGVYEAYVFDGWPTPLPQGRPGWDED